MIILHRKGLLRRSKGDGGNGPRAVELPRGTRGQPKAWAQARGTEKNNPSSSSWRAQVTATMRELGMSEEEIAAEWAKRSK
jgi:hypothetical protein